MPGSRHGRHAHTRGLRVPRGRRAAVLGRVRRPPRQEAVPKTEALYDQAKAICRDCPVLKQCRRDTLGEEYGVYGGWNPRERYLIRQKPAHGGEEGGGHSCAHPVRGCRRLRVGGCGRRPGTDRRGDGPGVAGSSVVLSERAGLPGRAHTRAGPRRAPAGGVLAPRGTATSPRGRWPVRSRAARGPSVASRRRVVDSPPSSRKAAARVRLGVVTRASRAH
ncbi:WhiB family transcriptional regulator [Streptomyces sp. NPDC048392]|uniref:WhiB family transcriptional regulator n=1 Tax=Streptomyces sp. NPDC048392 TaxID=3365543 RepID=UPI0037152EDD